MFPAVKWMRNWMKGPTSEHLAEDQLRPWVEGLENRQLLSAAVLRHVPAAAAGPAAVLLPLDPTATSNTITALAGQRFSGTLGTVRLSSQRGIGRFNVAIDWGDNSISAGHLTGASRGQMRITGNHTWSTAGSYDVTATVTSRGNSNPLAVLHVTAHVTENSANGVTIQPIAGESFTGKVASFGQSASPVNTHAPSPASRFQATIDWGDGTKTTLGQVQSTGNGGFDVLGTHTYAAAGTYRIRVIVYSGPARPLAPPGIRAPLFPSRIVGTAASTANVTAPPMDNPD